MRLAHVVPTSQAREQLPSTVSRFREEGAAADPVVLGRHRRPEAVLLPYETYEALIELAEEHAIAVRVRERLAADDGTRHSLEEVADELGIDLDKL